MRWLVGDETWSTTKASVSRVWRLIMYEFYPRNEAALQAILIQNPDEHQVVQGCTHLPVFTSLDEYGWIATVISVTAQTQRFRF